MTFDEALTNLIAVRDAVPSVVDQALDHVGQLAVERVLDVWPVATGRSAAAWKWTGRALVNDVPYVPYVHHGLAEWLVPSVFADLEDTFRDLVELRLDAIGGFRG